MNKLSGTTANHSGDSLKIGFIFDDSLDSADGVAQQVKTFGKWLSSQGHQVSYLVGETKLKQWAGGNVYSLARNQTVIFNGNRLSMPLPANSRRIKALLGRENFDVLHVQLPYSPFLAQKIIRAASPETAIIGTFHIVPKGLLSNLGSRLLRLIYGRSLSKFNQIISVSPPAAAFASSAFGIKSIILPNVVDLENFSSTVTSPESTSTRQIVFLGRLVKRKGAFELLKAFRLLHSTTPNIHLIIAGEGPQRAKLERYIRRYRLQASVELRGFINEEDKPQLLGGADIACFPALYGESFGIVLVEAMASNARVVLGGNNPGYESVLGGRPELLVNAKDTEQFMARMARLINDEPLAEELHGWLQAEVQKYDVRQVGPELLGIYHQAIAKKARTRDNISHAA